MIIGVDGNEANVREKVGVSVYTHRLLEYFKQHSSKKIQFIIFLKSPPREDLPDPNSNFSYEVVDGTFLWSQIALPLALLRHRFSRPIHVFFSPAHYAPRIAFCPTVITIHDVAYLHFPHEFLKRDLYQLKHWTAYSAKQASKIIAVSKTTKKDVMSHYHIPEGKISVVYNGFEKPHVHTPTPFVSLQKIYRIQNPYILYVGTLQPRKNITTLIRAFALFSKRNPQYSLVIAGKKGWLFDEIFKEAKEEYLNNKIVFTGYVTDDELAGLYIHADSFVLPSFFEGFGIPLLEAMNYHVPVISSFSSSLPEIGEEACLYFDPHDPADLVSKWELLKQDPSLRKELVSNGSRRISLFSWRKCAAETLKILTSVGEQKK